jgi:nucleotide-binding universal stress UspA family protein
VPLSGAPESRAILSVVKPLALRVNAEILLMEVVDPIHPGPGLESLSRELGSSGAASRTLTVHGDPTEQILRHAKRHDIDLVAMSAPGRKGSSLFDRSVPAGVLARIDLPILLQQPVVHARR